ncbi:MAG: hypothetical protein KJ000_33300 [Pirellulaceae bacterium]|nr:hypothetical protein [Pirellulaceae bacterium]
MATACFCLMAVCAGPGIWRPAVAGEQRIVLREYVNRQWTDELIGYPFAAADGACDVESIRLLGPNGLQPVQLTDVQRWPETGAVRSARLWLVADLAPLTENVYTVRYGPAKAADPAPISDLTVKLQAEHVEATTHRFGARLRLGSQSFDPPRAAAEVPGPLIALRRGDGAWFGGSRLYGAARIVRWSAQLAEAGPVLARVDYAYHYEDGNTVRLSAMLHQRSGGVIWESAVVEDCPEDGIDLLLSPGLPPLTLVLQREAYPDRPQMEAASWGEWVEIPLADYRDPVVTRLSPWADWWNTWTQTSIRMRVGAGPLELHVASHDPGAWVVPAEAGTMRDWSTWQHKLAPVVKTDDGQIALRVNHAAGARKWSIEEREPEYAERRRMSLAQVKAEWPPLDEVKDWILHWPADDRPHPRLFASPADLQRAWQRLEQDAQAAKAAATLRDILSREEIRPVPSYKDAQAIEVYLTMRGDPDAATAVRLADRARQHLGALGDFDKMRSTQTVAALYDVIMSSELVDRAEKERFRSQLAFLGYILARPSTWDIERGYRSYNPNMSLSYLLARGIVACAIPDHPCARQWVEPGLSRARRWLDEEVGPEGEWHESAHYSQVSAFALTSMAVAVKNAGMGDLFQDENLKKWCLWLAQIYTPRDPLPGRGGRRASPPIGRATAGVPWGLFGLMARATAETDPQYSRWMQWAWAETAYEFNTANHLGGFERIYFDPTLPAETPAWRSKLFPQVGPILRNGVGDKHENYLALHSNTGAGARDSELGCLALWFARGVPVAGSFPGGYKERHQLLMSRVIPAMSWRTGQPWNEDQFGCRTTVEPGKFSALPRQDYFSSRYVLSGFSGGAYGQPEGVVDWPPVAEPAAWPLAWDRRLLYVQDDDPGGWNYLVLRDSVSGEVPSLWQMWTVSEGLGSPQEVADRDGFTAAAGGNKAAAARRLAGDRFTAVGPLDVDVEYFVASPRETERWTMRWGHRYVDYSVNGQDYRDLLQLRLDGDGDYFVVMFPRFRAEAAPQFSTIGDGAVIRVQGEAGTDYCFLPAREIRVKADSAEFRGTAASVQDRRSGLVLALGAAGEIRYRNWTLTAEQAASLRVAPDRLIVDRSADQEPGRLTIAAPGDWRLAEPAHGALLTRRDNHLELELPSGVARVELIAIGAR